MTNPRVKPSTLGSAATIAVICVSAKTKIRSKNSSSVVTPCFSRVGTTGKYFLNEIQIYRCTRYKVKQKKKAADSGLFLNTCEWILVLLHHAWIHLLNGNIRRWDEGSIWNARFLDLSKVDHHCCFPAIGDNSAN